MSKLVISTKAKLSDKALGGNTTSFSKPMSRMSYKTFILPQSAVKP